MIRRIYNEDGLSPTLTTMAGGNRQPKITVREVTKKDYAEASEGDSINLEQPNSKTRRGAVIEPFIAASRGRNPDNPSDRTVGAPTEQRLEAKLDGTTNTISTVQKDNYVVISYGEQNGYLCKDGCVGTITTDGSSPKHNNRIVENGVRIRKLTPKECWRLMGFPDEYFERASAVCSNTQLYKQAGNSVVVDVLAAIFRNLLKGNTDGSL